MCIACARVCVIGNARCKFLRQAILSALSMRLLAVHSSVSRTV